MEELEELRLGENRIRSLKRVGQKPVLLDACMVYVYIYIHYRYILYITYIVLQLYIDCKYAYIVPMFQVWHWSFQKTGHQASKQTICRSYIYIYTYCICILYSVYTVYIYMYSTCTFAYTSSHILSCQYLPIYLPNNLQTYLPSYQPTYIPIYLSIYLPICLPVYLFICLSIYLFVRLSIYLSVCLSFCLFIYLSNIWNPSNLI